MTRKCVSHDMFDMFDMTFRYFIVNPCDLTLTLNFFLNYDLCTRDLTLTLNFFLVWPLYAYSTLRRHLPALRGEFELFAAHLTDPRAKLWKRCILNFNLALASPWPWSFNPHSQLVFRYPRSHMESGKPAARFPLNCYRVLHQRRTERLGCSESNHTILYILPWVTF